MRWFGGLALSILTIIGQAAYSVLMGAAGFSEPDLWSEIARVDTDSSSVVAFVLPRPAGDTTAPAANVIVELSLHHQRVDLKSFGDMMMKRVAAGPGSPRMVADSTSSADSSRNVMWSSELRGVPYDVRDRFAVRDSIYVNIRTAIPTAYERNSAWQARYRPELDTLMHSLCIGGHPVFPPNEIACADIKRVLPFTREENADGARFVWLMSKVAGLPYPYVATASIPSSPSYREVPADSVRAGDVAWWPSYVAVYDPATRLLRRPEGAVLLADWMLNLGPPKFFRRQVVR